MKYRPLALIIGATLLASATPGAAGDFLGTAIPESQWAGFYVGGHLGGAWSDTDWEYQNHNWFNTIGPALIFSKFSIDGSGLAGGGQAGYNFQSGAWVFGVEGSLTGTDLDASIRSPVFLATPTYTADIHYTLNIDWLATVTGRVGYAWGPWLVYGKGGWAGADIEPDLVDRAWPLRAKASTWADGYTLGGGGEYAFGSGFSLGVEYAYIDLDADRFPVSCPACPLRVGGGVPIVEGDIEIQSVTARVNYRFGR